MKRVSEFSTKVKKNTEEAFIHWFLSAIGQKHRMLLTARVYGGLVSAVSHIRGRKGGKEDAG